MDNEKKEEMKKDAKELFGGLKMILGGLGSLCIVGLFIMALAGKFDKEFEEIGEAEIFRGNDTKSAFSDETTIRTASDGTIVEQDGQHVNSEEAVNALEQITEEVKNSDGLKYFAVGDSYSYDNAEAEVVILDYGIATVSDEVAIFANTNQVLYVAVDFSNNSNEDIMLGQDVSLYVDDYQVTPSLLGSETIINGMNYDPYLNLNPGRKAKFIFCTFIPDEAFSADKVEFGFSNVTTLFKDNGAWIGSSDTTANTSNVSTDGNGIGNVIIDANPDRYIPEGVTGYIDSADGTFYSNCPTESDFVGQYSIIGGGMGVLSIYHDEMGNLRFELTDGYDAAWEDTIRGSLTPLVSNSQAQSYTVEADNGVVYVVSVYQNGLYLYTSVPNDENDWYEGFYLCDTPYSW